MTSCLQSVVDVQINKQENNYSPDSLPRFVLQCTHCIFQHSTMPSPSPGKCRGSVVRQLSLQNPTPLESPGASRGLKKQLSVDDARVLETIGVTCQGWAGGNERAEPALRIGSGDAKIGQVKVANSRPKPVKVAWADRKQESTEISRGVEVIAKKCQGQPRPLSVKTQRLRNPLLGNKDTLVYSKLQLAERLRNAWSEREKIKPNINIFLAHGSDVMQSDNSELTSDRGDTASQDSKSTLSDSSAPLDKKRKPMPLRPCSQDLTNPSSYSINLQEGFFNLEPELNPHDDPEPKPSSPRNEEISEDTENYLQELNKIEIRVTKIDNSQKIVENSSEDKENVEDNSLMIFERTKIEETFENIQNLNSDSNKITDDDDKEMPRPSAQDRRASFRRSSILHKTITESFNSRSPKENEKEKTQEGNDGRVAIKPVLKKPPLIRAFSAPSYNDQTGDTQKVSSLKKVKIVTQKKLQPTVSFDIPDSNEDPAALRERIKSAPIRRKLKSAAARRKNKEKDSSDDEKETKNTTNKKSTRRSQMKNADIVTMVSLVSPAESDTEDSVINLPLESFRGDEKEDSVKSENSTSRGLEEAKDLTAFVQKFVSLRKTQKSVTFQPHPILSRSYSASFPSRRAPAGTPIIIPTPVINNPALTPAQILERQRGQNLFTGNDGRGVKRKFLRSSTEVCKDEDLIEENQKPSASHKSLNEISEKNIENEAEEKENGEPEFKSPKERECWNLYQKMLAKGVNVSFDTVLRGMLTPTEYRLRKNSLLSTC